VSFPSTESVGQAGSLSSDSSESIQGKCISGIATQDQEDSDSDPNSVDHHCSNEESEDSEPACPTLSVDGNDTESLWHCDFDLRKSKHPPPNQPCTQAFLPQHLSLAVLTWGKAW